MLKFVILFLNQYQHRYYSRTCFLKFLSLFIVFNILLLTAGCNFQVKEDQPKVQDSQIQHVAMLSPVIKENTYHVGESFQIGDLEYRINGVRTSDGANTAISPKEGNIFLLIDLSIENRGSTNVEVRSLVGFKLKDKYGKKQAFSMGAVLAVEHEMDGTILAGSKMNGELGYEIPKVPQTYDLIITPNPFKLDNAVVKIPFGII